MNVETYTTISTLEIDNTYEQTFLVTSISHNDRMKTGAGKSFAVVTLKDVTGEIDGVVWGYENNLIEGQYANIRLETKLYKGKIGFYTKASEVKPLDETPINQHDYVKGASEGILTHYANEAENIVMGIEDPVYRDIMCSAIHKLDLLAALKESPYGLTGPMSYRGGLLVHTVHALRFALLANTHTGKCEVPFLPSLVIAGCMLRNIGWHTTTKFQGDCLRSRDACFMIGVQRASARYIDHLMLACESDLQITIPEAKRQALENICNDRNNIYTLEGKIVSHADDMADMIDNSVSLLQRKQNGNWIDGFFIGHVE